MAEPRCATCRYAEPAVMDGDDSLVLECRRYPPQTLVDEYGPFRLFTQVEANYWCGEYQPEEAENP